MDNKYVVELKDAELKLGNIEFGPFNLKVNANEKIAILGPSGAGKSTLLKLIIGESKAQSGEVRLSGKLVQHWSLGELSRLRAVLPQSHEVAFGLPVNLIIALGRIACMDDTQREQIIEQAAELSIAKHLFTRQFDTLSGGEKARVHLARVFAQLWDIKNALLLVDEPLAALDPGLQFQLMDAMLAFANARQHALIAILHDINHALSSFNRLWLVKDGKLRQDIRISALKDDQEIIRHLETLYEIKLISLRMPNGALVVHPECSARGFTDGRDFR